ncbi:hypothetical protein APHAL10511_000683 [Amanita phalloides]|nr:hypothetical protein APHAL10511_000683 [Amanita phalloides]
MLDVAHHVIHFSIKHELTIALILFFLSLIFGFPIGSPFLILLLLLQAILLLIQVCIGFGTSGVRGGSLAASYQSQVFGGFTPAGSCFSASQSIAALGLRVPIVNLILMLLSWVLMAAAIALFVDCSHREQALKHLHEAIVKKCEYITVTVLPRTIA